MNSLIDIPDDVLSYHDESFYDLVQDKCGDIVREMCQIQHIRSVQSLLRIPDVFDFLNYESNDLNELKQKIGFRLPDGQYRIKCGILMDVNLLIQSLKIVNDKVLQLASDDSFSDYFTMDSDVLIKHPFLLSLIRYLRRNDCNRDDIDTSFLFSVLENVTQNLLRSKSSYRYNEHAQRLSVAFFVLVGHNAYEFVRMNLSGGLSRVSSIRSLLDQEEKQIFEGEFRFE